MEIDLEIKNKFGRTLLMDAASEGDTDQVRSLLNKKANVNATTTISGLTPLHLAAMKGHAVVVPLLVDYRADIDARESGSSMTPLLLAAFESASIEKKPLASTFQALIDSKADITATDTYNYRALTLYQARGNNAQIEQLLSGIPTTSQSGMEQEEKTATN